MSFMGIGGKITATDADITKSNIKNGSSPLRDPNKTYIYRYGGSNPGNLIPKAKDFENLKDNSTPCLSFNSIPMPGAAEFTVEDLEATGLFNVVNDHGTHYAVTPRIISMWDWYRLGTTSIETMALKRLAKKWDGK